MIRDVNAYAYLHCGAFSIEIKILCSPCVHVVCVLYTVMLECAFVILNPRAFLVQESEGSVVENAAL